MRSPKLPKSRAYRLKTLKRFDARRDRLPNFYPMRSRLESLPNAIALLRHGRIDASRRILQDPRSHSNEPIQGAAMAKQSR